ncbi:MAG: ABC transporter permease [Clostridia bacterium]|nr:ABC transporter permease [Clostridia bacterium]
MHLAIEMLRSSVLAATPVLLAGLGGTYTYYANVFNIAMEGMMLIGAFMAVAGSYLCGSWLVGMVSGMVGGLLAAVVFAIFSVGLKTDEFVTGTALNMLALGGTTYSLRQLFHVKGAFMSPRIVAIPRWRIPLLDSVPVLGPIVSGHPFIVYVALAMAVFTEWHIFRTRFGLRLRAAGEDSRAVDSVGVSSDRIKAQAILASGVLCGLAGAYLSLGYVTLFAENMSNGRGWIALAVIILTRGRPLELLLMSLMFGFFDGLGLSLQGTAIPPQFTQMVPYIATIIALYVYSREKRPGNASSKKIPAKAE